MVLFLSVRSHPQKMKTYIKKLGCKVGKRKLMNNALVTNTNISKRHFLGSLAECLPSLHKGDCFKERYNSLIKRTTVSDARIRNVSKQSKQAEELQILQ